MILYIIEILFYMYLYKKKFIPNLIIYQKRRKEINGLVYVFSFLDINEI
jgi:hypothetical protein